MILACRWTEQFGEDWLQTVRPYLVALNRWMQLVARVHHAVEQFAVLVRELVVYIQVANVFPVGKFRDILVDLD